MKKILKIFLMVLTCIIATITVGVNAEAVKETIKVNSYIISKEPLPFPNSENNGYANFHVKKDTDGKYIFCIHYAKKPPVTSIGYTKSTAVTNNGMNYIMSKAYTAKTDEEFFKYQTALWVYMVENNLMEGTHRDIDKFINSISGATSGLAKEIRDLATEAKQAPKTDKTKPTISIDAQNITFTLNGEYYVSNKIKVNSSTNSYDVKLTDNTDIATVEKNSDGFIIKVKAANVKSLKTTINFTVNNYKEFYTSYYYTPSDASYQKVAATYKQQLSSSANGSVELTKTTKASIIKVDSATNEALEGAKLQVANSNGKIVDTWTTTKEAHELKDLSQGTYTVTEVSAPEGYEKSDETVTFKIDANGNLTDEKGKIIDKVTFTNKKKEITTGVKISKQDITNNKEVEGAKLVIKDYDGNVIYDFISKKEPTFIELKPGIYTLTETIAPEGYITSDETITFTVKEDGTIDTVVMYNTPNGKEVTIEDTASFKTITSSVIGVIMLALGSLLAFKKPKQTV